MLLSDSSIPLCSLYRAILLCCHGIRSLTSLKALPGSGFGLPRRQIYITLISTGLLMLSKLCRVR
jgi:hypothetical protein